MSLRASNGKWLTGALAKVKTEDEYELIMSTVPKTKVTQSEGIPALKLKDFGYQYIKDEALTGNKTCLRTIQDPTKGFQWLGQKHYDAVGNALVEDIYNILENDHSLKRVQIPMSKAEEKSAAEGKAPWEATTAAVAVASPLDAPTASASAADESDTPAKSAPSPTKPAVKTQRKSPTVPIFLSDDALTADTLLLVMQGTGAVRPGMWARALCMNASLEEGTIGTYLQKAKERGWGVIVTNPNENNVAIPDAIGASESEPSVGGGAKSSVEEFWLSTPDPRWKSFARSVDTSAESVTGSDSAQEHSQYVYKTLVMNAKAKKVVIVAHSFGGICVGSLFRDDAKIRKHLLLKCVGVGFTDACNDVTSRDAPEITEFYSKKVINWVASKKPLDKKIGIHSRSGTEERSAGHEAHEWTSACCVEPLFAWLDGMHAGKK